jgi:TolB-like protein
MMLQNAKGSKTALLLLGRFSLTRDLGGRISVGSKKARALLAYVAMQPDYAASRERLAALLWGDRSDPLARHNLRQCLVTLRRDLPPDIAGLLLIEDDIVGLDANRLSVDAREFATLVDQNEPDALARACDLYLGPFLSGFGVESEAFDEWVRAERTQFESCASRVLINYAKHADAAGLGAQAIGTIERLIAIDPLREDWQRLALNIYARHRGRDAAMAHAQALAARLKRELGVEPAEATKALVADIAGRADASAKSIPAGTALSARHRKPTIAVLPFLDLRQDSDHFADGIAMDLIAALSRIRSLAVVSYNLSFFYHGRVAEVRQIGRELAVDYVLEGSVRNLDDHLRITAQLVDTASGNTIWSQRHDWTQGDMFAAQDEIVAQIAACVEPHLYAAEGRQARRQPLHALDARGCVMRAFSLINLRSRQNYETAEQLLRRAIDLDPNCTQAYSLLAYVMALAVVYGWRHRDSTMALARDAANTAIVLDVDEPWAHFAAGFVHAQSRSPEAAIREFEKALALNPSFSLAHTYFGSALSHLGCTEAALEHIDIAERLNPRQIFHGVNNYVRANAHFAEGRYREAGSFALRSVRESPGIVTSHRQLVVNSALAGEPREAKAALDVLLRLVPGTSLKSISEALPYNRDSDRIRFLDAFAQVGVE